MESLIGRLDELIWYVAYGSNINAIRFQKYLDQMEGKPPLPNSRIMMIPYQLYFDKQSNLWHQKGVAFLNDQVSGITYGKAYSMTVKQFYELQKLEGPWYSQIVHLGAFAGRKAYSFTQEKHESRNQPSDLYLQTIIDGLVEAYPDFTKEDFMKYLKTAMNH
jgi:hypothetical protein